MILREIAFSLSAVLSAAVETKKCYLSEFSSEKHDLTRKYAELHEEGHEEFGPSYGTWQEEAIATGELFPGRTLVRPRVDFGNSARTENSRTCTKNYISSDSHSPGIFTVQCCCRHPKLLGISVMDRAKEFLRRSQYYCRDSKRCRRLAFMTIHATFQDL